MIVFDILPCGKLLIKLDVIIIKRTERRYREQGSSQKTTGTIEQIYWNEVTKTLLRFSFEIKLVNLIISLLMLTRDLGT